MRCAFLVLCFLLATVVENVEGTLSEFFNNLPSEVANAFNSAWSTVVTAIKKPVRIKRLGSGGKRKTTTTTTMSTSTTELEAVTQPATEYSARKLKLPVLPTPTWKTLEDWESIQRPRFMNLKGYKGTNSLSTPATHDDEVAPADTQLARLNDEESFGTLMFI